MNPAFKQIGNAVPPLLALGAGQGGVRGVVGVG
jgi:site-specific DNA-cytosine methylase